MVLREGLILCSVILFYLFVICVVFFLVNGMSGIVFLFICYMCFSYESNVWKCVFI